MLKKIVYILGSLASVILLIWFLNGVWQSSDLITNLDWTVEKTFKGLFLIVIYIFAFELLASGWFFLINSVQNQKININQARLMFYLSQVGKYIPGNFAHQVGRVVLAKKFNIKIQYSVIALSFENMLLILSASLLSIPVIFKISELQIDTSYLLIVIAMTFLVLPILIKIIFQKKTGFKNNSLIEKIVKSELSLGDFGLWAFYICHFLIMAFIFYMLLNLVSGDESLSYWKMLPIVSASWVIGFLTPGSPAGLGVREAVLMAGLVGYSHESTLLIVTAMFRVITITGDVLLYVIGLGIQARKSLYS